MSVAQRSPKQQAEPSLQRAVEVSIVMPCLNEAETLAACIQKAQSAIEKDGLSAEIIVADNGSTDGSQAIAKELGARLVPVEKKGYGSALIGGVQAARGGVGDLGHAGQRYHLHPHPPRIARVRIGLDPEVRRP